MSAALMLVGLALLAAVVAPTLLRQASWLERSPVVGMSVWLALSLTAVAATVLAGTALALPEVPLSTDLAVLLSACGDALRAQYSTPAGAVASATGALLGLGVVARTGYCLTTGVLRGRLQRTRHLRALALIARAHADMGVLVVDSGSAAAYCLPGRQGRIVLTTAVLAALDDDEVAAVVAHERAHLRGHHHLVLAASAALTRAFPGVPVFVHSHEQMTRLVEMHADDIAVRSSDRMTIATAVVRLAEPPRVPAEALGAGGPTAVARVQRLVAPARPLGAAGTLLAGAAVALLLLAPAAIVVAPAVAAASTDFCPLELPPLAT